MMKKKTMDNDAVVVPNCGEVEELRIVKGGKGVRAVVQLETADIRLVLKAITEGKWSPKRAIRIARLARELSSELGTRAPFAFNLDASFPINPRVFLTPTRS